MNSVGLAYANIELKNEVQNLSSRVTDSKRRRNELIIDEIFHFS